MKSTRRRRRKNSAAVPAIVSPPSLSSFITTASTEDQQQQQTSIHHFFAKKPKKRIRPSTAAAASAPLQKQKPPSPPQHHQQPQKPPQKQQQKHQRLQQRYLDLGQASFGKRTICHICGMLTVHGMAEDDKEHAKICLDYVHGVPFCMNTTTSTTTNSTNNKNNNNTTLLLFQQPQTATTAAAARVVLTLSTNAKIVEIRPSDSRSLWNKLLQVRTIVDQELGFVQSSSCSRKKENCRLTTFLYIHQKRVVGLLSAERIPNTAVYILHENNCERSTTPYYYSCNNPPRNTSNNNHHHHKKSAPAASVLGIHTIWVHAKFRKQGIAACLLDTARQKMWYGVHNVAIHEIAFSSPTAAGAAFARAYIKKHTHTSTGNTSHANNDDNINNFDHVLVYDCYSSA